MVDFLPFVRRWFDETFAEATRPQSLGWEAIASGRDTLIVAPTGSGKTLAAFLWALRNGQYDDPDGAAGRILFDDDD